MSITTKSRTAGKLSDLFGRPDDEIKQALLILADATETLSIHVKKNAGDAERLDGQVRRRIGDPKTSSVSEEPSALGDGSSAEMRRPQAAKRGASFFGVRGPHALPRPKASHQSDRYERHSPRANPGCSGAADSFLLEHLARGGRSMKSLSAWASPPIEESDERLIAQSRQGDASAFGRLVERHKSYAYWQAWRWLGRNDNEADEAVQQSFIKVNIALGQFDCRRETFRTWLWDIVRNTCMDMRRREEVRPKSHDTHNVVSEMSIKSENKPAHERADVIEERLVARINLHRAPRALKKHLISVAREYIPWLVH